MLVSNHRINNQSMSIIKFFTTIVHVSDGRFSTKTKLFSRIKYLSTMKSTCVYDDGCHLVRTPTVESINDSPTSPLLHRADRYSDEIVPLFHVVKDFNTQAVEQTYSWLQQYGHILSNSNYSSVRLFISVADDYERTYLAAVRHAENRSRECFGEYQLACLGHAGLFKEKFNSHVLIHFEHSSHLHIFFDRLQPFNYLSSHFRQMVWSP